MRSAWSRRPSRGRRRGPTGFSGNPITLSTAPERLSGKRIGSVVMIPPRTSALISTILFSIRLGWLSPTAYERPPVPPANASSGAMSTSPGLPTPRA